jgi:predicted Zn finger-like uncharacterized protein
MNLTCPGCGKTYRVSEERLGDPALKVRCKQCEKVFTVAEGRAGDGPEAPAAGPDHILVCDDAPFFRTMLGEILTEGGYKVETASNGEEALEKIASSVPALLILDLQMPGIDGFEVIRRIRGGSTAPSLTILAVSGIHTDSEDMIELEDAGANDYIGKQFKPEHLLKRVEGLMRRVRGGEPG